MSSVPAPQEHPTDPLVRRIHDSGRRLVLAVTGGGTGAIGRLVGVPGASRSVIEAIVPYADAALIDWLGFTPEHYCSPRTARAIAMASFRRARRLEEQESTDSPVALESLVGIGATSSLASDRPKHGPHRIHVATQTADCTQTRSLLLLKDRRTRAEEEHLTTLLVLWQIAASCGIDESLELPLLDAEQVELTTSIADPDVRDVALGRIDAVCVEGRVDERGDGEAPAEPRVADATISTSDAPPPAEDSPPPVDPQLTDTHTSGLIFPGAFNPLHEGHLGMAQIALQRTGRQVEFELSVENVDKLPLDYTEIAARRQQFTPDQPLWLTRASTFREKAALFPHATFIVGIDTLERIANPRYYGGRQRAMLTAIHHIAAQGCRFLVFGRKTDGQFESLDDLELPPTLRRVCDQVPPEAFREDISSTELRASEEEQL